MSLQAATSSYAGVTVCKQGMYVGSFLGSYEVYLKYVMDVKLTIYAVASIRT